MTESSVADSMVGDNSQLQKIDGKWRIPVGWKFGEWSYIEEVPPAFTTPEKRRVRCRCSCGAIRDSNLWGLLHGDSTQCLECSKLIRRGIPNPHTRTHGRSRTPEHAAWVKMKVRCYGGRDECRRYPEGGITVCDGWRESFADFFEVLGERPSPLHSLDRIDNTSGYNCGHCAECLSRGWQMNCRWATREQQNRNTSRNRRVAHQGIVMSVPEWADKLGISAKLICARLRKGWSTEMALRADLTRSEAAAYGAQVRQELAERRADENTP